MKLLRRTLLVLLLLVVVGLAGVWVFLDPLVATAIEKGSTFATGVETSVGSVDASLFAGRFGLKGLRLANPPGFSDDPFLDLGAAMASWQQGTILSQTIEMDELKVENVSVSLERGGSGTNYGKILDHLERLSSGKKEEPQPAESKEAGKRLVIRKIEVKNVRATLRMSGLPSLEVKVPSIVLRDFASDGSTTELVAKLTKVLLQSILESVLSAGKGIFPDDILKDLGHGLQDLGGALEAGAKSAVEGLEGALKNAVDVFKKK